MGTRYVKAFARRSVANEELQKWQDAFEDLKKSLELDPSLRAKEWHRSFIATPRKHDLGRGDLSERTYINSGAVYHMDICGMIQPSTIDIATYCYMSLFMAIPFQQQVQRMGWESFFFFRAPVLRAKESRRITILEKRAQEQFEKDKDEMLGKLKDLGNTVLGRLGIA